MVQPRMLKDATAEWISHKSPEIGANGFGEHSCMFQRPWAAIWSRLLCFSPLLVPPSPYSVCIYWILSACPEDENVSKKGGQWSGTHLKTVRPLQGAEQTRWLEGALVPQASCREVLGKAFAVAHSQQVTTFVWGLYRYIWLLRTAFSFSLEHRNHIE